MDVEGLLPGMLLLSNEDVWLLNRASKVVSAFNTIVPNPMVLNSAETIFAWRGVCVTSSHL